MTEIRVRSTAGGTLRMQSPWAEPPVVRGADSIASDVAENGAILLRVMTEPGQELIFAQP